MKRSASGSVVGATRNSSRTARRAARAIADWSGAGTGGQPTEDSPNHPSGAGLQPLIPLGFEIASPRKACFMKDALDVHRSLLAREVPHEIVRLPHLVLSADEIPEASGLPRERCVAVRVYQADDQVVATVVRAGELPHPGAVLAALGARTLRAAPPDVVNAVTDFAASLVSPVLIPDDMPVLADACIGHHDVVYAATGDGGTVRGIPSRWLLTASRAKVTELCAPESPALEFDSVAEATFDADVELSSRRAHGWS